MVHSHVLAALALGLVRRGMRPKIFLQGYCEATHGISETVLSLLPMRAQDIWNALSERFEDETRPAAV